MRVNLVSGIFGDDYLYADCYIDGEYYDFISSNNGVRLINEFGEDNTTEDFVEIENQLRKQLLKCSNH